MYDEQGINGILRFVKEKTDQFKNWVREEVKDATGLDILTATKAPQRLAFLGLVRINALGMADFFNAPNNPKLSVEEQNKLKPSVDKLYDKWRNEFGGNRTKLREVIAKGAKEKALGVNMPLIKNIKFVKKLKEVGLAGFNISPQTIGITGAEIIAAIKSALPIIKAMAEIFLVILSILLTLKAVNYDNDTVLDVSSGETGGDDGGDDGDDDGGFGLNVQTMGYGLLAVGVLATLTLDKKQKRKK
jgi:hypothetical protein